LIEVRAAEREDAKGPRSISWYAHHTGFNVALFPVIFFFSALYYTDVVSTLVVLLCYRNHLLRLGPRPPSLFNDFWTVLLGVAALFMRQTNVFWVVVYMGGLEVFHVLRSVQPAFQGPLSTIHDPLLSRSAPEGTLVASRATYMLMTNANLIDWLLCVLTVGVTALYNPMRVLRQIWPHITVMALFAGFVAWNGGVVLGQLCPDFEPLRLLANTLSGDKSNHIATLHMAQMLYIWPLFAFFSAPLFIPSLIATLTRPFTYLKSLLSLSSWRSALISLPYILLTIFISVAVVIYNTIIHPFTLADNRHYMFYVFRYTILRSPTIRLSLVAAYTLCRWLAWDALSGISLNLLTNHSSNGQLPSSDAKPDRRPNDASSNQQQPSTQQQAAPTQSPAPVAPTSSLSPPTSTALLLFVTTALSLITAPLVEPRYFILPWVFYRLLVPSWSWEGNSSSNRSSSNSSSKRGSGSESGSESVGSSGNGKNRFRSPSARLCGWFHALDPRLVLETVWFLAGNVGTMYVFLMRPFRWRGPDGVLLDGGRAQRFMW
jgi:alpha-1,2-glucosyltransferase